MDLHESFGGWVTAGARDELPRDVALHASGCTACVGIAAAVDALALVDPGLADMPPVRVVVGGHRGGRPVRVARAAVAAVAVVLTVAAGFVAGGSLFDRVPEPIAEVVSPTPAGAVLGGQPSATATPTELPTQPVEPSASAPASAAATQSLVPGPNPTMGGGPPPVVPGTPAPSSTATAAPTPAPTPSSTPEPPPPTPSPSCPVRLPCPSPSPLPLP